MGPKATAPNPGFNCTTEAQCLPLDEIEKLKHAALDLAFLRLVLAARTQTEGDIVHHAHVLEQRVMLDHEADAAILDAAFRSVAIIEIDTAEISVLEAGDRAQQRGLARPRRTEQRDKLARLDGQGHVVQRGDADIALAYVFNPYLHAVPDQCRRWAASDPAKRASSNVFTPSVTSAPASMSRTAADR